MLMEHRIRLFQDMEVNEMDVAESVNRNDALPMIENTKEEKDIGRFEQLEDISDFSRMEERENLHDAHVEQIEENSSLISEERMKLESIEEISNETITDSNRRKAAEQREKQKMYEDKVLAQFEDLEEIYLKNKGKTSNKEE